MIKLNKQEIDEIDFKIANKLKDNSKISYKELGEIISLSSSSVYERVKKMENRNVIKGYITEVDWEKFGLGMHAYILVKDDKLIGQTPDFLMNEEGIFNCWMVSGEYDYLVEIYVANNSQYEKVINYLYKKLGRTYTLFIIKNIRGYGLSET